LSLVTRRNAALAAERHVIRTESIVKVTAIVVLIGAVGAAAVFLSGTPSGEGCGFRLDGVTALVFVETTASAEQITHHAYQAHLTPVQATSELCMTTNAQSLMDSRLRSMAEQDGKSQVWITYYTDVATVGDQKVAKTFRVIFVREGEGWRRLEPKAKSSYPFLKSLPR
jgi:hypothetical protein